MGFTMTEAMILPQGVDVFERGWLSSNNVLLVDKEKAVLIDSGYATHSDQTLELVCRALGARPLDCLFNTHLHSDHCGGNAALQGAYPAVHTAIPPGLAGAVLQWDPVVLGYTPIGQQCPRFGVDAVLTPGHELRMAERIWQVHASPGHDAHSVIFFEPESATLISADALWQNGFGVIFQELEGDQAFDEVGQTLDLIERLNPAVVIPGHGPVFTSVAEALVIARRRLDSFVSNPRKHARHAAKVLLKFKLLEVQQLSGPERQAWANANTYMNVVASRWFSDTPFPDWIEELAEELVHSNAARLEGNLLLNA